MCTELNHEIGFCVIFFFLHRFCLVTAARSEFEGIRRLSPRLKPLLVAKKRDRERDFLPEPQLFDILASPTVGLSLRAARLAWLHCGGRNTMSERACNSMSRHNGKDGLLSALHRGFPLPTIGASAAPSGPGSGFTAAGVRAWSLRHVAIFSRLMITARRIYFSWR